MSLFFERKTKRYKKNLENKNSNNKSKTKKKRGTLTIEDILREIVIKSIIEGTINRIEIKIDRENVRDQIKIQKDSINLRGTKIKKNNKLDSLKSSYQ